MSYKVELLPAAFKEYQRIPPDDREPLKKSILSLEANPRSWQVKKLKGRDYYRQRCGNWRVIFAISDPRRIVTIIAIERRTSTTY